MPTERDFEQTAHLEMQHCDWLRNLRSYVGHFDDYNLLTLDIGEPLLSLQIAWENETRELKRWAEEIGKHGLAVPVAPISKYDSAAQFTASEAGFRRLDTKAKSALARIGEQEGGGTASNVPCRQPAEQGTGPRPSPEARAQAPASGGGTSIPPASRSDANGNGDASGWTADKTRSRILDLHAPYRAIGIANFYAAIGSFETAYLVLQRWLAIDGLLRADDLGLRDALPRWFRLRVMSEAARMYKNTSQEARLSERYRRHLDEISGEYRTLLPDLPTKRKTGNTGCFAAPAGPAPARAAVDAIAALTLGRVTSQIEFYEVSGLSGAVSQRHVEDAKTLARLDFRCFEDAFEPSAAPERVSAALALYQANAVVAWGRLAIRWVEAGRALRRVSDDERRTTLGEVRIAVGGAVERLEHQARVEESRRGSQGGSKAWGGVEGESTLDYARVARRVLQEALALDQ